MLMSNVLSLQQLLEDSARRYPNNIAIEDPGRPEAGVVIYSEFDQRADEVAAGQEYFG